MKISSDGEVTEWARTGGRPLSGAFDANGDLIVCDVHHVSFVLSCVVFVNVFVCFEHSSFVPFWV